MVKPALLGIALALAACGQPKVEVSLPLAILNVAPSDGATGVAPSAVPTVCFSRAMNAGTASGLLVLQTESGDAVPRRTGSACR
jgi:hypothetical protein